MNKDSWLIHNVSRDYFSDSTFRRLAFTRLGETLEETICDELSLPESLNNLSRLCILSEEVMLRIACERAVPDKVLKRVIKMRPFGENYPSVEELIRCNSATAVFPLINENNRTVETAHIWLVEGASISSYPDQRNRLEGVNNLTISSGIKVFISTTNPNSSIRGESWQLAFEMAVAGLSDIDFKRRVAESWIFTGKVRDNRIYPVVVNAKLKLNTNRSWMIPKSCDYGPSEDAKIRTAGTLGEACNWVNEVGIHRTEITEWPERVSELHSFVSKAVTPVITSAVLSGAKKIVLWHSSNSEESEKPAGYICTMLKELLPDCEIAEPRLISSNDLYEAELVLEKYLDKTHSTENIVFNITQGNRLMALAPHYLARKYPWIWLVYRDRDSSESLNYTAINYKEDGDAPTTMLLERTIMPS